MAGRESRLAPPIFLSTPANPAAQVDEDRAQLIGDHDGSAPARDGISWVIMLAKSRGSITIAPLRGRFAVLNLKEV
jgi:hypothetical protein